MDAGPFEITNRAENRLCVRIELQCLGQMVVTDEIRLQPIDPKEADAICDRITGVVRRALLAASAAQ